MKRFMYLSVAILCLSLSLLIGFHFGARTAMADVDLGGTGFVIGAQDGRFLLSDGTVWTYTGSTWSPDPSLAIPSQFVSQLKFWSPTWFMTTNDVAYALVASAWTSVGTPPGDPTNIEPTTWGQLKSKYDK